MAETLVECVPNFSEGRDVAVVDAIAAAIASAGVRVLDRTLDPDHNRSVITFAGPADAVGEAAVRAAGVAAARIDLTRHTGVHPRIGAADVIPFVPIAGISLEDCAQLAVQTAQRIWDRFQIPCYLYEAAARRPDRVNLENIRRGRFEGLREEVLRDPDRRPDIGGPGLHPTAGASVVGARKFLIAFNVNLGSTDLEIARRIAVKIRASSGGMPCVKAMGVALASRGLVQVSMNLTDFERTPVHRVFAAIRSEAGLYGVAIHSSELIGLIPGGAIEGSDEWLPTVEEWNPSRVLENRLRELQ
jgi:glutamate formiminotransferase